MHEEPLRRVLWIGGPPGSGKTSIARWLAGTYDLRVYSADAHTWAHHERALRARSPASQRWESMTPDERWITTPPHAMAEDSLQMNADRFRMIVDDVRRLPDSPLAVVEGTPLLPWLVVGFLASPAHAVWLMPTAEFQRARLLERPTTAWEETSDPPAARANRIERELLVAAAIERGARERGLAILRVDQSRNLRTMEQAVAERFRPIIDAGPRATTVEARRSLRRSENETILRQLTEYLSRVPRAGEPETYVYPFSCECGRSGCTEPAGAVVRDYARVVLEPDRLLVARGHLGESSTIIRPCAGGVVAHVSDARLG